MVIEIPSNRSTLHPARTRRARTLILCVLSVMLADVKKRKIPDSPAKVNYTPANGIISSVDDAQDHQYAAPALPRAATSIPSHDQSSTASGSDCAERTGKKRTARKSTSPLNNISKTIKDVENTIMTEIGKHEPHLLNGLVPAAARGSTRDEDTNTDPQHKVDFSIDALSSNTLTSIFEKMRTSLTRRVSKYISLLAASLGVGSVLPSPKGVANGARRSKVDHGLCRPIELLQQSSSNVVV